MYQDYFILGFYTFLYLLIGLNVVLEIFSLGLATYGNIICPYIGSTNVLLNYIKKYICPYIGSTNVFLNYIKINVFFLIINYLIYFNLFEFNYLVELLSNNLLFVIYLIFIFTLSFLLFFTQLSFAIFTIFMIRQTFREITYFNKFINLINNKN